MALGQIRIQKTEKETNRRQQGWAIPGVGHKYYTLYYTGQKYEKLYNTLYQYYTKSKQLIFSVKQQQTPIYESNLINK